MEPEPSPTEPRSPDRPHPPLDPLLARIRSKLATSPDPTGRAPLAPSLPELFSAVSSTVTDLTPDDRATILARLMAGLTPDERDEIAYLADEIAGWPL